MAEMDKLQAGLDALRAGRKDEAVAILTEAAKENRDNERVWMALGLALDDPQQKQRAFERALQLNPANEKVKIELSKLKALSSQPKPKAAPPAPKPAKPADAPAPTAPAEEHPPGTLLESEESFTITGSALPKPAAPPPQAQAATESETPSAPRRNLLSRVLPFLISLLTRPFKLPFKIDGAPPLVTVRGLANRWFVMGLQSIRQLFTNKLVPEQEGIQQLTLWDAIMPVFAAAFVFGSSEFVGRLIRGIFEIGSVGLGGVFATPFFASMVAWAAVVSGILVGGYAGQVLLERQLSKITISAHLGSYATAILAAFSIEAVVRVVMHVLIGVTSNGSFGIITAVISIVLALIIGFMLNKEWLHRYELEDRTVTLATLITVGGGWLAVRLILALLGAIFRIPFFP